VPQVRVTHPSVDFWVDVRLREFDGRWIAVADLADEPELGLGDAPEKALDGAFAVLGSRLAAELRDRTIVAMGKA
jgi:hypothetical protein